MAGKYIEKALEKYDKLPKELIRNLEKQVLSFNAQSAEFTAVWHDKEELNVGDTFVELIYRVSKFEGDDE